MPDKVSFGYGFPCDGPGRGGTCDISAFDGLYLAIFWMLNIVNALVLRFILGVWEQWRNNSDALVPSVNWVVPAPAVCTWAR